MRKNEFLSKDSVLRAEIAQEMRELSGQVAYRDLPEGRAEPVDFRRTSPGAVLNTSKVVDAELVQFLLQNALPIILKIYQKKMAKNMNSGEEIDDLISEAYMYFSGHLIQNFEVKTLEQKRQNEILGQFIKFSEKCIHNKATEIYRTRMSTLVESKLGKTVRAEALKHAEVMFLTGSPSLTEVSKATSLSRDTVKDLKRKLVKQGLIESVKRTA